MKDFAANFTPHFGFEEEWHRSDLPHRNKKGLIQFITFRLADSLPQNILREIRQEVKYFERIRQNTELRNKYQTWLDKGLGCCALSNRHMAQKVMEALCFHDGSKYDL